MAEIRKKGDAASKKEQDTYKDMRLVQEMYARGFDFYRSDIYKSKASKFQIVGDKLLPPFNTIDGMGDKAAELWKLPLKTDHTSLKTISVREQKSARHWLT